MTVSVALLAKRRSDVRAELALAWTGRQDDPVHASFQQLADRADAPEAAIDFAALALAVYAADKAVPRSSATDGWTRDIRLLVPQLSPGHWDTSHVARLLRHLTGDRWAVEWYEEAALKEKFPVCRSHVQDAPENGEPVALFSGGLDSFGFAATSRGIVPVAHQERSTLAPLQRDLASSLGLGQVLRQFSVTVERRGPLDAVGELESTTRSRSLIFFAAAVLVATAAGSGELLVPENGFIALNPPLVPGRRGSLTTRTTHPWTMHLVNELLAEAHIGVMVSNPLINFTKGEVARMALAAVGADTFRTVSCSRPRARQRDAIQYGHCGYCYPCFVRRAGFHAAGVPDETPYREDPFHDSRLISGRSPKGDDFRAVATGIRQPFTVRTLTSAARLPPDLDLAAAADVIERNRLELVNLVQASISASVRRLIGW